MPGEAAGMLVMPILFIISSPILPFPIMPIPMPPPELMPGDMSAIGEAVGI